MGEVVGVGKTNVTTGRNTGGVKAAIAVAVWAAWLRVTFVDFAGSGSTALVMLTIVGIAVFAALLRGGVLLIVTVQPAADEARLNRHNRHWKLLYIRIVALAGSGARYAN